MVKPVPSAKPVNPYQSPLAANEPSRPSTSLKSILAWGALILVSLGAIAYIIFTGLLLFSPGSDDQKGGLLFVLNLPVVGFWVINVIRVDRRSRLTGLLAAGVQVLILGLMLWASIGEVVTVFEINGTIIVTMLVLAWICWVFIPHPRTDDTHSPAKNSGVEIR